MPQYLLSVHDAETGRPPEPEQLRRVVAAVDAFNAEVRAAGAWVFGGGLHPADTATVVRVDGGDVVTTDGPLVGSEEPLGGFWIIAAPDLDAALRWAEGGALACGGPVEVRPFRDG